ncbi:MAG: 8-oxoguanine DNA glycosylase [Thermoplasmata archaeon]|jgi:N-glycosylase/DNA lyase|nr:8-oxoguanine DNA glycosylase [Thermoplasmata archaeon]
MRFRLDVRPLDLDLTLGCGQVFRWRRRNDGSWRGVLSDQVVTIRNDPGGCLVEATPGRRGAKPLVHDFFRATDDVRRIQRRLGRDPVLAGGVAQFKGLRIVKMDEWECLVSYMLATYANIPRITKMVDALAVGFGDRISDGLHSFPTIEELGRASLADLQRCGLGYRAKYVHEACRAIERTGIAELGRLPYEELREELTKLPGVGDKVADCVSLFGFGKTESFPIDVWIERALGRLYHQKGSYRKLRAFASERFGEYAGYAQEYLYFNERVRAADAACAFSRR